MAPPSYRPRRSSVSVHPGNATTICGSGAVWLSPGRPVATPVAMQPLKPYDRSHPGARVRQRPSTSRAVAATPRSIQIVMS